MTISFKMIHIYLDGTISCLMQVMHYLFSKDTIPAKHPYIQAFLV